MLLLHTSSPISNIQYIHIFKTLITDLDVTIFIITELPYNDYFEYYGPDFKLHISPSNMANQNTPEYLDKIKARLFENMRMLPHAPGVQMTGQYKKTLFYPAFVL